MNEANSRQSFKILCFGYGYTASFFAAELRKNGFRVVATCRSKGKQKELQAQGVVAYLFNGSRPMDQADTAFDGVTHILSSIPPDDGGDPVVSYHGRDIASLPDLKWAGYLSTTGVYGDHRSEWVDEDTERTPSGERGKRRVVAEMAWQDLCHTQKVPVHIFRLAGIYGPGRNALLSLQQGRAKRIDKPGQVFSRIHVEDIARILAASIDWPNPGAVYNLADDCAEAPEKVVRFAAGLTGVAPPPLIPFAEADLSPVARSFYDDSKRVRNDRIKTELGISLKYPSYKEGLKALYKDR